MNLKFVAALLAGSAVCISAPAVAQQPKPQEQPAPTEPDSSDAAADAAIANARAVDEAQAKIELLQAQVEALQTSIEQVKASMVKTTPSWKGAPQLDDKESGFSFKPRGAIQLDGGYTGFPPGNELRGTVGGLNFQNLGWNSRARRLLLGADGTLPGGFRYSAEFNFAQAAVDFEDVFIAYDFKNHPFTVQIGHIYPFSSLETMTSSKFTSFMERAGITDAFNYNRRLGLAFTVNDKQTDSWIIQAGLFNEPINNGNFTHTGWQASLRGVYSPMLGTTRLHVGANFQHRVNTREALVQQYRARPLNQLTDQRFIDTGNIASDGDDVAGLEFAAIHKGLHFAAEAQKVWVRKAYSAAEAAGVNGDSQDNDVIPAGSVLLNGNPSFSGGYAEVGYYLTGETRGYKGGRFDRTKVLHPFNEGGWGALQVNARLDYLNLNKRVDTSSASVAAPFYVNGGKQLGYQVSAIWNPTDYIRFMAQYSRLDVTGGPRGSVATATTPGIFPIGTLTPANRRKYSVDTWGARAQVDF
jgi:phosphate-selective porin OprO and OprP